MRYVIVVTRLHKGVYGYKGTETYWGPVPLDTATLAEAFDRAAIRHTSNIGSWGNVGCGSTWVAVSDDVDEQASPDDVRDFCRIDEPDDAGDVPEGVFKPATLRELRQAGEHI